MTGKSFWPGLAAFCGAAVWGTLAGAQTVECGKTYTVVRGDTLSLIAQAAYGELRYYRLLYDENAAAIGPDPAVVEEGTVIYIPCLDGSDADTRVVRRTRASAQEAVPGKSDMQIRIVAASGWAPYTDEGQAEGGLIPDIVRRALSQAEGGAGFKIDFINDWGAQIDPLIMDNAYDFGLAWQRPDCSRNRANALCGQVDWSDPIFQQVVGYYTRTSFPAPNSVTDLEGTAFCRPAGYPSAVFDDQGIAAPGVTVVEADDPVACFDLLLSGQAQVVGMPVEVAEGVISSLGAGDKVTRHARLDTPVTVHAVIASDNPNTDAYLQVLNAGLKTLKDSGEWFSIVRRHMAEHKAKQVLSSEG